MKQNMYDDEAFFSKYSQMNRSVQGLAGAGEWHTLQPMLPDFEGKAVLDLGCGFGWHCQYAIEHGAASVVGVDISEKMLAVAREKTSGEIKYVCSPIEEVEFAEGSFDAVISSLAFHYLASFDDIAGKVWTWLKPGGDFVFSAEHPVFTAQGCQDWQRDTQGIIEHFPVDNYFYSGKREANFLGETVIKYHRTLTDYFSALLQNGFEIRGVAEPQPSAEMLASVEGMQDELRRPMILIVAARKTPA